MMLFDVTSLPAVNATLNLTSAILLGLGFFFIHRRNIPAHRACMVAAFTVSALFLMSYLFYHYQVGSVQFTKQGWIRPMYFTILFSHTILAVTVVPLALRTLYFAVNSRFDRHVRIARWTFPVWIYVSITGVVVYLMLYRL